MLRKLLLPARKISVTFRAGVAATSKMSSSNMSSICETNKIDYNELKKYLQEEKIYLIDVREKTELEETGTLPRSINIPLAELPSALQLSKNDFQDRYKAEKPDVKDKIIFSCRSGKRSCAALGTAVNVGYLNALHYGGGWLDWEKHLKDETK